MIDDFSGMGFSVMVKIADATTATALTLVNENGVTIAPAAGERLVITDIQINAVGANEVDVFADVNANGTIDAGELVFGAALAAGTSAVLDLSDGLRVVKAMGLKVKASAAGNIRVFIKGRIITAA